MRISSISENAIAPYERPWNRSPMLKEMLTHSSHCRMSKRDLSQRSPQRLPAGWWPPGDRTKRWTP